MADETPTNTTVSDVLEVMGATINDAAAVADSMGLTVDQLRAAEFGSIDADQVRAMCVTLHRSADEVLAIASAPAAELDRRKARHHAVTELEDSATIAIAHMRGAAHLLKQWCYADGSDSDSGAALDLLADVLEDTAGDLEQARDALESLKRATL